MTPLRKHALSFLTVCFFVIIALASKVNKMRYGAFNYYSAKEERNEGNYLVRNDGTKIYGKEIEWRSGLLKKERIEIDRQEYRISEIRGYFDGAAFYHRKGNEYIKRIVHGKLNVYVDFNQVTTTETSAGGSMRTRTYTQTDHYGQRGEDGELIPLAGQKDIRRMVEDCPLSVEMISISNSRMRKALRKNRTYLNDVFEVYNNGCKPVR